MNSDIAVAALAKKGFRLARKPDFEIPELPTDITDLGDDSLMELFVVLTSWTDHISSQLAIASINEREAERSVSTAESQAMLNNWKGGSGDRVAIAKAQIAADPLVQELVRTLDERYAFRKLVDTLYQSVERDAALVSRELTRRTSDNSSYKSRARKYTA
jgi:hypothetical protein